MKQDLKDFKAKAYAPDYYYYMIIYKQNNRLCGGTIEFCYQLDLTGLNVILIPSLLPYSRFSNDEWIYCVLLLFRIIYYCIMYCVPFYIFGNFGTVVNAQIVMKWMNQVQEDTKTQKTIALYLLNKKWYLLPIN